MGCNSSRHAVPILEPAPAGKVTICLLMGVHQVCLRHHLSLMHLQTPAAVGSLTLEATVNGSSGATLQPFEPPTRPSNEQIRMKVLQGLCLLDRDEDPFLDQLSARTAELFGVSCCSCGMQPPDSAASLQPLPNEPQLQPVVPDLMLPRLQAGCQVYCWSLTLQAPPGMQCTTMLCSPGCP